MQAWLWTGLLALATAIVTGAGLAVRASISALLRVVQLQSEALDHERTRANELMERVLGLASRS